MHAATSTLSSKYQIAIPKAVREAQGWDSGQQLAFVTLGSAVQLVAVPKVAGLRGFAKGVSLQSLDGLRDREDRRFDAVAGVARS